MRRCAAITISIVLLSSCEESLPPRNDTRYADPKEVLEVSFDVYEGVVVFLNRDSTANSNGGIVSLAVKNAHDEVLSGTEEISIDITFSLEDFPAAGTANIHGDRNNLINRFNFQGDVFMLDGDILTIHPDSSARFLIVWDHIQARFWDYGNPVYVGQGYVVTDSLQVVAQASIRLYEQQVIPLLTEQIRFKIFYFFAEVYPNSIASIDEIEGWADSSGAVNLSWVVNCENAICENPAALGWEVQKSIAANGTYQSLPDVFIPTTASLYQREIVDTTLTYLFIDSLAVPGIWYYRLALLENLFLVGPIAVGYSPPVRVEVP